MPNVDAIHVQKTFLNQTWTNPYAPGITLTKDTQMNLKSFFFGTVLAISGGIISGGLVGEWWAFAILIPAGAYAGWTLGERKPRNP